MNQGIDMKHDEEWLEDHAKTYAAGIGSTFLSDEPITVEASLSAFAQSYAEHLNRWRVTENELPEYGQLVDIIWSGRRRTDYQLINYEDEDLFCSPDGIGLNAIWVTHWKPVDLPEIPEKY